MFRAMTSELRGTTGDPRVAVEYNALHEKAGSIRMYEMLPYFTGRPTLEGVYNQASLMTHPVYYLASEMGAASPNPFKSRYYSRFDVDSALVHLRLLHATRRGGAQPRADGRAQPALRRHPRGPHPAVHDLPPPGRRRVRDAA